MTIPKATSVPKKRNDARGTNGGRSELDENLAVLGADADEEADALGNTDEAVAALEAENGDPFPAEDEDEEELIPLPPETLARGARRS